MGKSVRGSSSKRDKKQQVSGRQKTRSSAQSGDLLDPHESERNEKALKDTLTSMGLYAAQTKGDGNCLFRALSDQLWGHDLSHAWLRREICAYLVSHRLRCENFVDSDGGFDKYIRDMQTTGTYGGHLELQVCAWIMRVNIKVIQPTSVYVITPGDESPSPTPSADSDTTSVPPSSAATLPSDTTSQIPSQAPSPSSSLSSLTPSPEPIPPVATDAVPTQPVVEEVQPEASSSKVNTIYVAYHAYEHYSSVRNLAGPKTGLPCTKEIERSAAANGAGARVAGTISDDPVPTQHETLILSSLPSSAYSLVDVRRAVVELAKAEGGEGPAWESVVEVLLDRFDRQQATMAHQPAGVGKGAWREVEGLAGTESDASVRPSTTTSTKRGGGSTRARGRGRGRGKSRSSLSERVAGRRAGSSPSTSSEGTVNDLLPSVSRPDEDRPSSSTSLPVDVPRSSMDDTPVGDDGRSSPSLSPPPDSPPASPDGGTRMRLKRPPPSSAGGSYTNSYPIHSPSTTTTTSGRPGKERRKERKQRVDREKAVRRSAGAVGVGLRTRSRAGAGGEEKVGEVEGGIREIHI